MTARLARICRYPVKSIGGEDLAEITLTAGQTLPGDRRFGVMHARALHHLTEGRLHKWLPKSAFLRGAAAAPLQAVRGGWQGDRLVLTHPDLAPLTVDPLDDGDSLVAWVAPLWAEVGKAPPARVVEGPQALADIKQPWVSVLSLSSLDALEQRLGRPLGTDRWRGNLWIEGWEPFAEHDLRLHQIRIGEVLLKLTERIDRCPATSVDTTTGRLDGDMPRDLDAAYLHHNFGIYGLVQQGGTIRPGDRVEVL